MKDCFRQKKLYWKPLQVVEVAGQGSVAMNLHSLITFHFSVN